MAPQPGLVHLPNGQNLSVIPVFGGLSFKSLDLHNHRSAFPPGWTISLNEQDPEEDQAGTQNQHQQTGSSSLELENIYGSRKIHSHRYKRPTLQNDHMYISAISNPNSAEFKPASSPTRQIAMMLWATLWWYFHQPEPEPRVTTEASAKTAESGKPKAEWKININKEGIFKGRNLLAKLERMGLITTEDSSVGTVLDERNAAGLTGVFVTRRAFWQLDARIYLFTLTPVVNSPMPGNSPLPSRPGSPQHGGKDSPTRELQEAVARASMPPMPGGPFQSNSHLPTFYPPHPAHYTFTNSIRHPIRPKPFRQGETFYTRFVPSVGQYLSFRVASLSLKGCSRQGPWTVSSGNLSFQPGISSPRQSISDSLPTLNALDLNFDNDVDLLHKWMNDPRVAYSWGEEGPRLHQEDFLRRGLSSRHSFPIIGCWDGRPFGYFEIYWVKEDILGKYLGGEVGDWDRGIHCLVGEQEFRGSHRVHVWLSALVHYCWLADMRTNAVFLEPRVDNAKLKKYCEDVGFYKEREITFPHKQSNLMKIRRDVWEKPAV